MGVEPLALMRAQMDLAHRIALAQVSGGEADGTTAEEREELSAWAGTLEVGQVHRLWQLLLKGHEEVRLAPDPLVSLRMALLRVLHAGQMPDPGKLAKRLEEIAERGPAPADGVPSGENSPPSTTGSLDWASLVDKVDRAGQPLAASVMRLQVRVVELTENTLKFSRDAKFTDDVLPILRDALLAVTGKRWTVEIVADGAGAPSLVEQAAAEREAAAAATRAHPLVKAAFEAFPDAELIEDGADAPRRREIPWSRNA